MVQGQRRLTCVWNYDIIFELHCPCCGEIRSQFTPKKSKRLLEGFWKLVVLVNRHATFMFQAPISSKAHDCQHKRWAEEVCTKWLRGLKTGYFIPISLFHTPSTSAEQGILNLPGCGRRRCGRAWKFKLISHFLFFIIHIPPPLPDIVKLRTI